jgi:hypothetical protein
MLRRHYSLILVVFWIALGVCLVAPEVLPEGARKHLKSPSGGLVGVLAFLFAIYNFARWWAAQSLYRNREAYRQVNPLSIRNVESKPFEPPRPELDFIKLPDDESKPNDANPNGA